MRYAYAGLWVRFAAFALDYLIVAAYLALVVAVSVAVNNTYPTILAMLFANSVSS